LIFGKLAGEGGFEVADRRTMQLQAFFIGLAHRGAPQQSVHLFADEIVDAPLALDHLRELVAVEPHHVAINRPSVALRILATARAAVGDASSAEPSPAEARLEKQRLTPLLVELGANAMIERLTARFGITRLVGHR